MSTLYDTLEFDGIERTFAAWGIDLDNCVTKLGVMKPDTFTFAMPTANITDDPIFPYEAFIIARTNRASATGNDNSFSVGSIEFQGKRIFNPMRASGSGQGVSYEFQGPWYDADITQYLQTFKGVTTNYAPGEVVLNTAAFPTISTSGLRFISVGDQIQSILQFVLDQYAARGLDAPFQYVGRNLHAGAIDLNVGVGPPTTPDENTDASGMPYLYAVNAGTTIDVALFKFFLKSDIVRPMSSAQLIQQLLDASPRTNVAFDYSTTPPTLYIQNIDNLGAVSLPLFDGGPDGGNDSINLQRRDDLVPSAVIIGYRITNTVGGTQVIDYVVDKWGPHGYNSGSDPDAGPGVLIQILDLQGFNRTFTTATLDCEPLACIGGTHAQRRVWWAKRRGGEAAKLADSRVRFQDEAGSATSIPNAKIYYASDGFDSTGTAVTAGQEFTTADYSFFVNRLMGGSQHSWMTVSGVPVKSVKVKITASMQFAEYDCASASGTPETDTSGNVVRRENSSDQQHCNIDLTNGVSGDYGTEVSVAEGEAYILGSGGIAEYLFTMLSVLQYEGEYVKVKAAFDGGVSMLNRVNLSGGRAEWTSMNAQVQDIIKDWGNKETTIRIGISKHLNAGQLSSFLNMWRFRRTWYNPAIKGDNTIAGNGEVQMPKAVGSANTVEGLKLVGQATHLIYTTPPTGTTPGVVAAKINHDPKAVKDILAATTPTPVGSFGTGDLKEVKPRECQMCDETGALINGIFLVTGFYSKP